jgi:hypothetical protein
MSNTADLIAHRSELLARVVLTRRLNIDVVPFDEGGEMGLDFLCSLRDEKVRGLLLFGVVVRGTTDELQTSEDIAKHVGAFRKKLRKRTGYFFPVIVLLFSMHKDEAYFAWLVEPCENTSQLVEVAGPEFKEFDLKQLDRMIKRITSWYKWLAKTIVSDAGEIDSTQCPEDE